MEITLIQGILLAVVAFICALDSALEVFFWFRPMVVAFFAGIVLGDIELGCKAGAVAELSYMGMLSVGGTVPPNPLMAGMMTVVMAYTTGQSVDAALGLSLPFALLAQWFGIFCNSSFAMFLEPLDKAAAEGNTKKYTTIILISWMITGTGYALMTFLSAYALQGPIQTFVNNFPAWLVHGFEVAGGLLPAVGLTLLMVVMLKKENVAYLFLGFLMTTFTNVGNILPVAVAAIAVAFLGYLRDEQMKKVTVVADGGAEDDGI
jgi:PTS system galactosamine-specific IIC component